MPNKATSDARAAIAAYVEGNVERLYGWLEAMANGQKVKNADGTDSEKWLRAPDPWAAHKAFMEVVEFHIPKLARSEHTGLDGTKLIPDKIEIVLKKAESVALVADRNPGSI